TPREANYNRSAGSGSRPPPRAGRGEPGIPPRPFRQSNGRRETHDAPRPRAPRRVVRGERAFRHRLDSDRRHGGIGKTVLAQALFKDEVVRQTFPDRLVWITVVREPTYHLPARLREITRVLGGASDETVAPETLYRTTLANKA